MHEKLTYERLARLGFHRWWTPLAAVLAAALVAAAAMCSLVVIALVVTWALGGRIDDGASIGNPLVDNLLALASIALLIPVTLGFARLVQRRPAGTLHSVVGRLRWRWFTVCGCLAVVVAVLVIVTLVSVYGSLADLRLTIDPWRFLGIAVLLLILVPLQAAGEEYATRGFVLQALGAYHRWIGILGSALAFTLLHGIGTWSGFVALFVGGVIWALLVIRTGGLEVSIAAHAATNLFAFLATAATGGLDTADTTTAADATLGSTLIMLGGDLTYMACIIVALKVVARHRPGWMPVNRTPAIEQAATSIVQVETGGADASVVHH